MSQRSDSPPRRTSETTPRLHAIAGALSVLILVRPASASPLPAAFAHRIAGCWQTDATHRLAFSGPPDATSVHMDGFDAGGAMDLAVTFDAVSRRAEIAFAGPAGGFYTVRFAPGAPGPTLEAWQWDHRRVLRTGARRHPLRLVSSTALVRCTP